MAESTSNVPDNWLNLTESMEVPAADDPDVFDPACNPNSPVVVSKADVLEAHYNIKSGVLLTPCTKYKSSALYGCDIYLKKDLMQYTGSFKERGCRNYLMCLSPEDKKKGVVASSAGNHAQALAYHGRDLGISVTVFMPTYAPLLKIGNCAKLGAKVVLKGKNLDETKRCAMKYGKIHGMKFVNGYDHPAIIAGQGSLGFEILEQVPNVDAIVVPVGGGGMLAGIVAALKNHNKNIKIYSVESKRAPGWQGALKAGKPTYTHCMSTLADGLSVPTVGCNAFETCRDRVDDHIVLDESYIAKAIVNLLEDEKCVVEGASAISLGAVMANAVPDIKGKTIVCILCGGNIDTTTLSRVIDRGLAIEKRLVRFEVVMPDRCGSLLALSDLLYKMGACITHIQHEGAWIFSDVHSVNMTITIETRGGEHFDSVRTALEEKYKQIKWAKEIISSVQRPSIASNPS